MDLGQRYLSFLEDEEEGGRPLPSLSLRCDVASGKYKYACLRVTDTDGSSFLAVRSGPGAYHADVAEPAIEAFEELGYRAQPLGGGRIVRRDGPTPTVEMYGFSVGFGGSEGGPPGHGMRDHSETAALVRQALPSHAVTFSSAGY